MRIAELLEAIKPYAPLSPAEYAVYAQQRDVALKQAKTASKQRQQQQQKRQQQVLAQKRQAAKIKPIKLGVKRRRKARRRV